MLRSVRTPPDDVFEGRRPMDIFHTLHTNEGMTFLGVWARIFKEVGEESANSTSSLQLAEDPKDDPKDAPKGGGGLAVLPHKAQPLPFKCIK